MGAPSCSATPPGPLPGWWPKRVQACAIVEPSAAVTHRLGHDRQVPDFRLRVALPALALEQALAEHLLRLGGEVPLPGLRRTEKLHQCLIACLFGVADIAPIGIGAL